MTTSQSVVVATTSATGNRGRVRRSTMFRRRQRFGWLFVAPFALVFVAFLIVPLAYALWLSLHTKSLAFGTRLTWFDNYTKAFADPSFLTGVRRVVAFAVVMVPIQLGIALVVALVLDTLTTRLAAFSRLFVFLPYAVPAVIGALMWGFLYSPSFGPVTQLFGTAAPN